MKNRTDNPTTDAGEPAVPATPLPTHGGVYEFDPATRQMRALEGGSPGQAGGDGNGATTGEQA